MQQPDPTPRPIGDVLHDIDKGITAEALAKTLQEIVTGVGMHGSGGALTLKIEVKPAAGDASQVLVSTDWKAKLPRSKPKPATFFVGRGGALSRDHPTQMTDPALQPGQPENQA